MCVGRHLILNDNLHFFANKNINMQWVLSFQINIRTFLLTKKMDNLKKFKF